MRKHKHSSVSFFNLTATERTLFRFTVVRLPLIVAPGSFVLSWLIRGKSLSESLTTAALVTLLVCFIGLLDLGITRWTKMKSLKNTRESAR